MKARGRCPCILTLTLILHGYCLALAQDHLIIDTTQGKLEGLAFTSRDGKPYYAFKGIPYASKTDRFQVAKSHPNWNNVRKATEFGNQCPHFDVFTKAIVGDEDCLFLNVFTLVDLSIFLILELKKSRKAVGSKIPVMVWFHPGAFEVGRSDDYDAKFLMDGNVVLVTLNYRLGAFGFLSTGDDAATPNLGMRDQVLALQWVKQHIESFGGDTNRVTIFGESAGGASVHYHLLSEASQGLFHNGISMSGTTLAPWALQKQPELVAKQFAELLDCPTDSTTKMVECLKTKSIFDMIMTQAQMKTWAFFPFNVFAPSVEPKNSKGPKFLEDAPLNLMKSGKFSKVPWIVGFVEDEGCILSAPLILNENFTKDLNDDWKRTVPKMLLIDDIEPQEKRDKLSDKILKFYFENEEIGEESWDSLTNLISDRYFVYPANKAAKLHAKHAMVYPYEFTFHGGLSRGMEAFFGIVGDYGIAHTDDLQYMFNGFFGSPEFDETKHEALDFSKKFVKLWTSFAENSVPTATWGENEWKAIPKSVGKSPVKYLDICAETEISATDLKDRMALWDEVNISELPIEIEQLQKDEL